MVGKTPLEVKLVRWDANACADKLAKKGQRLCILESPPPEVVNFLLYIFFLDFSPGSETKVNNCDEQKKTMK